MPEVQKRAFLVCATFWAACARVPTAAVAAWCGAMRHRPASTCQSFTVAGSCGHGGYAVARWSWAGSPCMPHRSQCILIRHSQSAARRADSPAVSISFAAAMSHLSPTPSPSHARARWYPRHLTLCTLCSRRILHRLEGLGRVPAGHRSSCRSCGHGLPRLSKLRPRDHSSGRQLPEL